MTDLSEVKSILDFLGEENVDKIRAVMTDAIIDNLQESIDQNWVVLPSTFCVFYEDVANEVCKKYKNQLKDEMCNAIEQMLNRLKECALKEGGSTSE